jgi:protein-L-isoaspartate(D-aspartate) O-methyltransferase
VRIIIVLLLLLAPIVAGFTQDWVKLRAAMVSDQMEARDIRDARVLAAMRTVERHLFVPASLKRHAYDDSPLPIGEGQTISQPYIVALMTQILGLKGKERVLEIGTGSGYQAAVLSLLAREVCTIEIRPGLHEKAAALLFSLGCTNVTARAGDGYFGWSEKAPFDCIMITAAVNHIPPPLVAQLSDGGRMVLPLGNPFSFQELVAVTKRGTSVVLEHVTGVLFVPMTGEALKERR